MRVISDSYGEQLTKEHKSSKWGTTGSKYAGKDIMELLTKRDYIRTVLDYGAGKGTLGQYVAEQGWKGSWTNYDPGIPEYNTLPECEKQYDLVITSDVLEHIEPPFLSGVITQLGDLTGKVLYNNICCVKTNKTFLDGPYVGQDLHLTIELPTWWRNKFKADCELPEFYYRHEEFPQRRRATTRCVMIHER